jgi:hypothetical protein
MRKYSFFCDGALNHRVCTRCSFSKTEVTSLHNEISTKSRYPIVPRRPLAQEPSDPMRECYQPFDRIGADLSPPVSTPNTREPARSLRCGLPRCACALTATTALRRPRTPPLFPPLRSPPFADCVARTCLCARAASGARMRWMPSSAPCCRQPQ